MEITLHTGAQGDRAIIHVDWFDHNNIHRTTDVEIAIQEQDKPRTLEISVDGAAVSVIVSSHNA